MSRIEIVLMSCSSEETQALGREIGLRVGPGAVIALYGDLGSGKTALVQGLARGIGVPEDEVVTSPTYTLINEYSGHHPLYHIDLYRLDNAVDFDGIGLDEALYGDGVAAVEWAERLHGEALSGHLAVYLHMESVGPDRRRIRLIPHGPEMVNLLKDLKNVLKEK